MLSIIIPSKNEPWLQQTVDDIEAHAEGDIEILVGDDAKAGIGQRAMMNNLAHYAYGEYIMKVDAHCSFGQGFDRIMLEDMQDNVIMAPYMLVLDGEKWITRHDKRSSSYCFDTNLVMNYNLDAENKEPLNETMCLQGSCFLMTTENYWKWNICDESLGSWGGQGVELGIKAYLNGGVCMTTKKTYYGHVFRHNEEDFPYKRDLAKVSESHQAVIKQFKNKSIAGLIEKYNYPCDWTPDFVNALT